MTDEPDDAGTLLGQVAYDVSQLREEVAALTATLDRLAAAFDLYQPMLERFTDNPAARFLAAARKGQ